MRSDSALLIRGTTRTIALGFGLVCTPWCLTEFTRVSSRSCKPPPLPASTSALLAAAHASRLSRHGTCQSFLKRWPLLRWRRFGFLFYHFPRYATATDFDVLQLRTVSVVPVEPKIFSTLDSRTSAEVLTHCSPRLASISCCARLH